jgi:hypothetical protein
MMFMVRARLLQERLKATSLLTVVCTLVVVTTTMEASGLDLTVVQPQRPRLGKTYGEWGTAWWQWVLGIPLATNPLLDTTGAFCAEGQEGRVWFLAGTLGGAGERHCTVPAGKYLFFPIVTEIWIATEPGETASQARREVNTGIDGMNFLKVTVNGRPVRQLRNHRAESPVFQVVLPINNLAGLAPGAYGPAVTDGYWAMLGPVASGSYDISIRGRTNTFAVRVLYHLTVE